MAKIQRVQGKWILTTIGEGGYGRVPTGKYLEKYLPKTQYKPSTTICTTFNIIVMIVMLVAVYVGFIMMNRMSPSAGPKIR